MNSDLLKPPQELRYFNEYALLNLPSDCPLAGTHSPLNTDENTAKNTANRDWSPFILVPSGQRAPGPRAIEFKLGTGDRLRAAAFAEVQARDGFIWAAKNFELTNLGYSKLGLDWLSLAAQEQKHLVWLLNRLGELDLKIDERQVSDALWKSYLQCDSSEMFAVYMATAEERGRKAGERFYHSMNAHDPVSAQIFGQIAQEETSHIELTISYFPDAWKIALERNLGFIERAIH